MTIADYTHAEDVGPGANDKRIWRVMGARLETLVEALTADDALREVTSDLAWLKGHDGSDI